VPGTVPRWRTAAAAAAWVQGRADRQAAAGADGIGRGPAAWQRGGPRVAGREGATT
jgi:hypothetical protein